MIPCPSPNGTHDERLYIVHKPERTAYGNVDRLYLVRKPERRMALDAAIGGSPSSPDYASYAPATYQDAVSTGRPAGDDNGGPDLIDKVRELLAGKLEPGDLDALIKLIQPMPAQDRRRRLMAHDELQRHVSTSLARRAQTDIADLTKRFPNLKGARVIG